MTRPRHRSMFDLKCVQAKTDDVPTQSRGGVMFHTQLAYSDDAVLPVEHDAIADIDVAKLGPTLKRAREAKRLTLEDVAATTRISLRYLAAIENSRFDAFVSAIYAVGFVRAYARMVGMSEKWAVETLRAEAGWR
ncbi:MAG: helix-turn-helix domain-containing protein [Sphingomonadales bacterium]|nr:MAG: helix-turn-helix domain-containing protein [Sphingomonadales bacterium]